MPGNPNYAIGVDEQFYATEEATYNVFVAPTATDGIRVIRSTFTPSQERANRRDKKATRSWTERMSRRPQAEFSVQCYVVPYGASGTDPDDFLLWKNGIGQRTADASGISFTPLRDETGSLCLHRICDNFAESITGAIVNTITINFSGSEEATVEYGGVAANYIRTGTGTLAASAASGASAVVVTNGQYLFDENSYVQFVSGSNTYKNGTTGYRVTTDPTTTTVLITPVLEADLVSGATIKPYFPPATVAGSPLSCVDGSLTYGGEALQVTTGSITINQNKALRNDIFGEDDAIGYSISGHRNIEFSFTGFLKDAYTKNVIEAKAFANKSITLVLGTGVGTTVTITMPYCECNIVPFEVPEEPEVTFTLTGLVKGSGTGENEITVRFE